MGLDPIPAPVNVSIAVWPWDTYMGEDALRDGVDVGVSSWRQRGTNTMPPAIKATGNYLNSSLARIEANQHGYDEAIMLNEQGKVCEGTGENLFIVRDGVISTPPVSDGILEGITRDSIMQIAVEPGLRRHRGVARPHRPLHRDEFFMTGSAAEVVPVRSVDHRIIGPPAPSPWTCRRRSSASCTAKRMTTTPGSSTSSAQRTLENRQMRGRGAI